LKNSLCSKYYFCLKRLFESNVGNFFLGKSIGIDEPNTFQLKILSSIIAEGPTALRGLWAIEWAWHPAETKESTYRIPTCYNTLWGRKRFLLLLMGSEKLPSAWYILSLSSIPFYSTSNWYKNVVLIVRTFLTQIRTQPLQHDN